MSDVGANKHRGFGVSFGSPRGVILETETGRAIGVLVKRADGSVRVVPREGVNGRQFGMLAEAAFFALTADPPPVEWRYVEDKQCWVACIYDKTHREHREAPDR